MAASPPDALSAPAPSAGGGRVDQLVDVALLALADGNNRAILELVRDQPGALGVMADRFGTSKQAVSQDLTMFHSLEYEVRLEALGARYDVALLDSAGLTGTSRVLDIGCGTGSSTRAAARRAAAGSMLGIDCSAAMVKQGQARMRTEGLTNIQFVKGDAEVYAFETRSFDVAISRFGAMYFAHPTAAFANIGAALKPGGRLALLAWQAQERNEWMTAIAGALAQGRPLAPRGASSPGAFGLADEQHTRSILTAAGFADIELVEVSEPVSFGPDVDNAFAMISTQGLARDLLDGADTATAKRSLSELRELLTVHDTPEGVLFGSTCWIITAHWP